MVRWIHLGWFGLVLLLLAACGGPYGRLQPSHTVSLAFERHEVLGGHSYYTSGPVAHPTAILAIDASYRLQPGLWRPVTMTPQLLQRLVNAMTDHLGTSTAILGAVIVDADGAPVGRWYSPFARTTIRFADDNSLAISLPSQPSSPRRRDWRRPSRPFF